MDEINELLEELKDKIYDIEQEKQSLEQENSEQEETINELEAEIENLKEKLADNDIIGYIKELEKDFYFRTQQCKNNLTVEKIVYDLTQMIRRI